MHHITFIFSNTTAFYSHSIDERIEIESSRNTPPKIHPGSGAPTIMVQIFSLQIPCLSQTHSTPCKYSNISFLSFFLFFKIYLLIMLLQLSHFHPFTQLHPAHPLPPTFPTYSSCPWVILISSLASTFPIIFLPSPCLFSTYHLCYLFSVPFPPLSPSQSPIDNPPCDLHFCGSVSVLVVCLVLFWF